MIEGQCRKCGDCCLYGDAIIYNVYGKKADGLQVFVFMGVHKDKENEISPCRNLIFDIYTREAMCTIYRQRPSVCKQFPYHKGELIFKNCGYSWEDK